MTALNPDASQQAVVVEAALVLLERMGLSPADLTAVPPPRKPVPTFAAYVPVVSAVVSDGTRRAYGSYWDRVVEHWGDRRLDEPSPSEIRQLMAYVKTHVVARHNAWGGRSAQEHLVAALRCLYQRAVDDGLITEADNPARKVAKPRRLPSTRAVPDTRLAEINEAAAATGDDPELDTLLLRLHTETACRRGGALALRPDDLDPDQCLVRLREKGETVRWQPVSPTLMSRLVQHGQQRHAPPDGPLLRYADGRPVTSRRYDHLWIRRFETWENSYVNIIGLGAAVHQALELRLDAIGDRTRTLGQPPRHQEHGPARKPRLHALPAVMPTAAPFPTPPFCGCEERPLCGHGCADRNIRCHGTEG